MVKQTTRNSVRIEKEREEEQKEKEENKVLYKTPDENTRDMITLFQDYLEDTSKIPEHIDKMATEYIVVEDLDQLEQGRYIRWIKNGVLVRGGHIVGISNENGNDMVLCKTSNHIMQKFRFDECPCFQKLNMFEQWYFLNSDK